MTKTVVLSFLFFLFPVVVVHTSPNGASSCRPGGSAVGGPHLTASNVVGQKTPRMIEEGGYTVMIGPRVPPTSDNNPLDLLTQTRYPITLFSPQCGWNTTIECELNLNPFRGFLIRLGRGNKGVDTTSSFELSSGDIDHSNSKLLDLCTTSESPSVGGITHVDNTVKARAGAFISLPWADTNVTLDVSVVVRNCQPGSATPVEPCDPSNSTYYHTRYYLMFEGEEQPSSSGAPNLFSFLTTTKAVTAFFCFSSIFLLEF